MNPKYKRIVLKLSGEALKDTENGDALDPKILKNLALELKEVYNMGVQICLVVGGGNIFRGLAGAKSGVDRTTGDYMGMLATVINGLALMNALESEGLPVRVQTAIPMEKVAEPFILRRAVRHLEKELATPTSRPTQPPPSAQAKSARTAFSKPQRWTASTTKTPTSSPTP